MELGNYIQQVQPTLSIGKLTTYLFFKKYKKEKTERRKKEKKEVRLEDNLSNKIESSSSSREHTRP